MKKYITLLLAVLVTAFTVNAFAFTPPPKPDNGWYIVDQANKLTAEQKESLNKKIDGINKSTKNQFGVLILQTMDGSNIDDVAQSTFREWRIGEAGLNNGILLVISAGERKTRLQTGKGAEGDLPDLRAHDILNDTLKPFLKKGDYFGGIVSTIDKTSSYLESRAAQKADPKPVEAPASPVTSATANSAGNSGSGWGGLILIGVLAVAGLTIFFFVKRSIRKEEQERQRSYDAEQAAYAARKAQQQRDREANRIQREAEEKSVKNKVSYPLGSAPLPVYSKNNYVPVKPGKTSTVAAAAVGAGALAAAAAAAVSNRDTEAKKRKQREDEEARRAEADARRRREDEEAAAARRRSEESSASSYSSYSSSSSSSSYDSGSSSSYDSGGSGFGGGDSGGGGASSDF